MRVYLCYVFVKSIAEKYSYTRILSSIGVFILAALSCYDQDSVVSKTTSLPLAYKAIFIQYMICYPRSSRKDSRSYTDSRRLSIRSTNGKDYIHCTCDNVKNVSEEIWTPECLLGITGFQDRLYKPTQTRWHIMNIHSISCIQWIFLVPDTGFSPVTFALQGRYSEWAELIRRMSGLYGDRTHTRNLTWSLVMPVCQKIPARARDIIR